jgi:SNF2 family DNA or RNA helicase
LKRICNFAPGKTTSPKTEALLYRVEDIVENGRKAIVFSQYVDEGVRKLEPLLKRFGTVAVTGDTSASDRLRAIDEFQQDRRTRVFLATAKTAGEGITLTAASYVIHFDHWWNPAVQWQAEDRAHRKGQSEPVTIYSFWMQGTFEERIRELLAAKGLLHQQYVDSMSEKNIEAAVTLEELCRALGLDFGRVRQRRHR